MTEDTGQKQKHYIIVDIKDEEGVVGRSYCSNCKTSVYLSSNYCYYCGVKFTEVRMNKYKKDD